MADPRTLREERSLGPMRRTIANRLQESYQNAVHVTVSRSVDATSLLNRVERAPDQVSIVDGVLLGLSRTLAAHPAFNATFEDGVHRLFEDQHVGIAVDIEAGLVTPIIRDLGSLSLEEIAAERRRVTDLVQAGEHSMSDLQHGTFTVSNLGPLGVDAFTPIINPPEVAILGVNRLREQAVPGNDAHEFTPMIRFDLTIDHRVVDGADAARVLQTLDEALTTLGDG